MACRRRGSCPRGSHLSHQYPSKINSGGVGVSTLRLMRLKGEVGSSTPSHVPNLNGAVQAGRRKGVGILGVDGQAHNIMAVALERLHALPSPFPIPQLNRHVITGRQHEGLCGMHDDGTDVVWVGLEGGDLFGAYYRFWRRFLALARGSRTGGVDAAFCLLP